MELLHELPEIALPISEPEYRAMPELSYSNLSTYMTLGYNGLDHLFDKKESPSLTLGSAVDAIITGGEEEFNRLFFVANVPSLGDKMLLIANYLYDTYNTIYDCVETVPATYILGAANLQNYQPRWKSENRIKDIVEKCSTYYMAKKRAAEKTVLSVEMHEDVKACVEALRTSPATRGYFAANDPLSPIRRYYQLKFKAVLDDVGYRNMADLLIVDYDKKIVYPIDLKTSLSCPEWDFQENFKKWHYYIQARLYWRIIRDNMDRSEFFKDFTLADYKFIIVNPKTLTPLVWEFPLTQALGTLVDDDGVEIKDPFVIGKELRAYLDCKPPVPNGINEFGVNKITCIKVP